MKHRAPLHSHFQLISNVQIMNGLLIRHIKRNASTATYYSSYTMNTFQNGTLFRSFFPTRFWKDDDEIRVQIHEISIRYEYVWSLECFFYFIRFLMSLSPTKRECQTYEYAWMLIPLSKKKNSTSQWLINTTIKKTENFLFGNKRKIEVAEYFFFLSLELLEIAQPNWIPVIRCWAER